MEADAKGKAKAPKAPKEPKGAGGEKAPAKRPSGGGGGGGSSKKKKKDDDADGRNTPVAEVDVSIDDLAKRPDPSIGAHIVVIHPGSTNLRVGLASAPSPRMLPHCIAFRRTPPDDAAGADAATLVDAAAAAAPSAQEGEQIAAVLESSLPPLARQLRASVELVGQPHPPTAPR